MAYGKYGDNREYANKQLKYGIDDQDGCNDGYSHEGDADAMPDIPF